MNCESGLTPVRHRVTDERARLAMVTRINSRYPDPRPVTPGGIKVMGASADGDTVTVWLLIDDPED